MKSMVLSLLLFLILIPFIGSTEAECLRCQGVRELGCTGDSKFDFISKCGSPDHIEEVAEQTSGYISRNEVDMTTKKIEIMYYNCGDGQFIEHVKVKGGKVVSIEHGARGSGPVKCQ